LYPSRWEYPFLALENLQFAIGSGSSGHIQRRRAADPLQGIATGDWIRPSSRSLGKKFGATNGLAFVIRNPNHIIASKALGMVASRIP